MTTWVSVIEFYLLYIELDGLGEKSPWLEMAQDVLYSSVSKYFHLWVLVLFYFLNKIQDWP